LWDVVVRIISSNSVRDDGPEAVCFAEALVKLETMDEILGQLVVQ
jgi:hypothetical protein